ncbi:dodecin domain-containing protein [Robertkochia marina]|uniref:Dodecin domain-containing protein n=1 Tax=Robertkochia marina TaxID=1227945 RepID=A0A4S3M5H6_9FLAO|nr:dodecin family protein [Robertkochia marina]THD69591.1 dodecin domain-containing protein [Robertkochia marina]TRZ47154.1 dodecin domain-containing protein [Robertkochia marina]
MSVLKVIEVLADSDKSWEDAAKKAVEKASNSVDNIKSVYINEQSATIKDGEIQSYRVNVKITFGIK